MADRAIAAATDVIIADGVAALTVDGVARRVGCSVSAVHTAFGGREGLLAAVFERHAPLPTVVQLMTDHPERFTDFESGVRAIYTVVFDTVDGQQGGTGVLEALLAEVLAKPNGSWRTAVQRPDPAAHHREHRRLADRPDRCRANAPIYRSRCSSRC